MKGQVGFKEWVKKDTLEEEEEEVSQEMLAWQQMQPHGPVRPPVLRCMQLLLLLPHEMTRNCLRVSRHNCGAFEI